MLYQFFYQFKDIITGFNVFRYITFRASLAALSAFVICLVLGPFVIRKLKGLKIGEKITKEAGDRFLEQVLESLSGSRLRVKEIK